MSASKKTFANFWLTTSPKHPVKLLFAAILAVSTGCQTTDLNSPEGRAATAGYNPQETDKLFIVDCLLPGQVRKLGSQMTYLSARRAVRVPADECEMRGGEYVAYDRANQTTGLKIWLPLAQEGDAEAQLMVGEIYEKGLGETPSPEQAAAWYRKAAEQGNAKAQLNLGHLYEKGLGVPQDRALAVSWYRKASGLENSDLQFATAVASNPVENNNDQELEALRQDVLRREQENAELRTQLTQSQQQLLSQEQQMQSLQNKLDSNKLLLAEEQGKASSNAAKVKALQQEINDTQTELNQQNSKVSTLQDSLKKQVKTIEYRVKVVKVQEQQLAKAAPVAAAPAVDSTLQRLNTARDELQKNEALLKTKEAGYLQLSGEMTKKLETLSASAGDAAQKLKTEQLRTELDKQKQALQAQVRELTELKKQIAKQHEAIAEQEKNTPTQLAFAAPSIEIINPPMVMTRGVPSLQLRSISQSKEITGRVYAAAGLKSLHINDKPETADEQGFFKINVDAAKSATQFKIVAIDAKNKQASMTFNVQTEQAEPVVATNEPDDRKNTSSPGTPVDFGKFYALIIGNNNYAQLPTLKTAVNDAKSLDSVLRQRYGFETTVLINANRHQIMTALNNLRTKLKENDNLLIYYAGHGERDKTSLSAYWLPTDAEIDNTANWISSSDITQYLSIMSARHILVVADSCYSGAMTSTAVARLPDDISPEKREKWLKFMATRKARTVLTSGGVQPVLDQGDDQHSVFAKALLNTLQSNNALIGDYDVFRTVSKQVRRSASKVGFEQSPQYAPLQHAGHEGSPFFFVPKEKLASILRLEG